MARLLARGAVSKFHICSNSWENHGDAFSDTTGAGDTSAASVDYTGGTLLSAAPGVYFNAVRSFWVFARAQIPFYKNLDGEQDVKPSVALGLQYQVL